MIIKNLFSFGLFLFVVLIGNAQSIEWQRCIGGSLFEYGLGMSFTNNNEILLAGLTYSEDSDFEYNFGQEDVFVSKVSSSGELIWAKNYGGTGHDGARCVVELSDGSILIAGYTTSNDNDVTNNSLHPFNQKGWIVKLNSSGQIIWQNVLYIIENKHNYILTLTELSNGNILFTGGSIDGDSFYGLLNSAGNIISSEIIDEPNNAGWTGAYEAHLFSDQSVLLTYPYGRIQKLNASSNLIWQKDLSDGNDVKISGFFESSGEQFQLIRDVSEGESIEKVFLNSITGDVVSTIEVYSYLNIQPFFMMYEAKYDMLGNVLLGGYYEGLNPEGNGHSDFHLLSILADNQLLFQQNYGGSYNEILRKVLIDPTGSFYVFGETHSADGDVTNTNNISGQENSDAWLVKINSSLELNDDLQEVYHYLSPNPAIDQIQLLGGDIWDNFIVRIFDLNGNQIFEGNETSVDVSSYTPGMYFLEIEKLLKVERLKFFKH